MCFVDLTAVFFLNMLGRGRYSFLERKPFEGCAGAQAGALGFYVTFCELSVEIGDIAIVVYHRNEGNFHLASEEHFPVNFFEPRMGLDLGDILDSFFRIFVQQFRQQIS